MIQNTLILCYTFLYQQGTNFLLFFLRCNSPLLTLLLQFPIPRVFTKNLCALVPLKKFSLLYLSPSRWSSSALWTSMEEARIREARLMENPSTCPASSNRPTLPSFISLAVLDIPVLINDISFSNVKSRLCLILSNAIVGA